MVYRWIIALHLSFGASFPSLSLHPRRSILFLDADNGISHRIKTLTWNHFDCGKKIVVLCETLVNIAVRMMRLRLRTGSKITKRKSNQVRRDRDGKYRLNSICSINGKRARAHNLTGSPTFQIIIICGREKQN